MLGKIIGGVIGTVFGPIGTGVGVAIGHAFDSYNKTNDVSDKNSTSGDGFNQTERSKNEQDKYEFKAATIKEYKKTLKKHLSQSFNNGDSYCGISLYNLGIQKDHELHKNLCTAYRCSSDYLEADKNFIEMIIETLKDIGQTNGIHGAIELNHFGSLGVRWNGEGFSAAKEYF